MIDAYIHLLAIEHTSLHHVLSYSLDLIRIDCEIPTLQVNTCIFFLRQKDYVTYIIVVVSTHSLDPCLFGESDHPAFGPPASLSLHLASSSITPAGSVHKSMGDSVVRMCVQLKRWCGCCIGRHSGDGCDLASTLCKYDLRK